MQIIMSDNEQYDDVLLNEKDIIITSARLEYKETNYAIKYVSSVTLDEQHPPRLEAKLALLLSLFALVVLIVYRLTDKVTANGFIICLILLVIAATTAASIQFLAPSRFKLNLTLVNGESATIKSKNERKIHRIHQAITTAVALNRQEPVTNYHGFSHTSDNADQFEMNSGSN